MGKKKEREQLITRLVDETVNMLVPSQVEISRQEVKKLLIGGLLRVERNARGLNLQEVSSQSGISSSHLSEVENIKNPKTIGMDALLSVLSGFGIKDSDFWSDLENIETQVMEQYSKKKKKLVASTEGIPPEILKDELQEKEGESMEVKQFKRTLREKITQLKIPGWLRDESIREEVYNETIHDLPSCTQGDDDFPTGGLSSDEA